MVCLERVGRTDQSVALQLLHWRMTWVGFMTVDNMFQSHVYRHCLESGCLVRGVRRFLPTNLLSFLSDSFSKVFEKIFSHVIPHKSTRRATLVAPSLFTPHLLSHAARSLLSLFMLCSDVASFYGPFSLAPRPPFSSAPVTLSPPSAPASSRSPAGLMLLTPLTAFESYEAALFEAVRVEPLPNQVKAILPCGWWALWHSHRLSLMVGRWLWSSIGDGQKERKEGKKKGKGRNGEEGKKIRGPKERREKWSQLLEGR